MIIKELGNRTGSYSCGVVYRSDDHSMRVSNGSMIIVEIRGIIEITTYSTHKKWFKYLQHQIENERWEDLRLWALSHIGEDEIMELANFYYQKGFVDGWNKKAESLTIQISKGDAVIPQLSDFDRN